MDRLTLIILLEVYSQCIEFNRVRTRQAHIASCCVDVELELAPLVTYQLKFTKTHYDRIIKSGKEHADKADGLEIRDVADLTFVFFNWYTEKIPVFRAGSRAIDRFV